VITFHYYDETSECKKQGRADNYPHYRGGENGMDGNRLAAEFDAIPTPPPLTGRRSRRED